MPLSGLYDGQQGTECEGVGAILQRSGGLKWTPNLGPAVKV